MPILPYDQNVYITVTLSPAHASSATALASAHPDLRAHGPVGALPDVQRLSVPAAKWPAVRGAVVGALRGVPGVVRVEVQEPARQRVKRDEL